ncbi:lipopolysaccharide biosynthesis protein [Ferruginibacter yonginensis]|uniref:Lipopolysaccharide biosynthesis protein n=1 Tax=Ferruginibacter yonginensis TaxID=1310416 RepID=A0ABV8QS88_9BACT
MSSIKKLAGDTLWYGGSSIVARFLNYLLTPYLTLKLSGVGYGEVSLIYAAIPFLNVLFTYGLETAYFRFSHKEHSQKEIYSTASISIFVSTLILSLIFLLNNNSIAQFLQLNNHPEFITYSVLIIALDTLTTLPFAKLRQDGRPVKFAFTRLANIFVTIGLTYFFISVCPTLVTQNPNGWIAKWYIKDYGVGYVIVANLIASALTFLLLLKEVLHINFSFNGSLWKQMIIYALPLLIAGFGGMINETFDRIMLGWWAPVTSVDAAKFEVGIYSACYKLSILITLFIQGFRMGAEPFFFKQAAGGNPQKTYARVMKFFVITITIMFLFVALYLDVWKHFIRNQQLWVGLKVVPILLLANMFLGIYYNLSIWYKLTNKTKYGAYITFIGAAITLAINAAFIPYFSYMACAWATFFSYGSMMVISFIWGQKHYKVPYAWKKLVAYIVIVVLLFFIHKGCIYLWSNTYFDIAVASILLYSYLKFLGLVEQKEFAKLPVIGKYFISNKSPISNS